VSAIQKREEDGGNRTSTLTKNPEQVMASDESSTASASRKPRTAKIVDALTEAELSDLCRVQETTAAVWRKRRTGPPYVRLGNEVFYPRAALTKWLEARALESVNATDDAAVTL
jgi:hypothetical protein